MPSSYLVILDDKCYVAKKRSDLRHNWLAPLLRQEQDYLLSLFLDCDAKARNDYDRYVRQGGRYDAYLKDVATLIEILIDGYSPARLLEGIDGVLDQETRNLISRAVHEIYLEATQAVQMQEKVKSSLAAFSSALMAFREVWFDRSASSARVAAMHAQMKDAGQELYDSLGLLPEGFVLP